MYIHVPYLATELCSLFGCVYYNSVASLCLVYSNILTCSKLPHEVDAHVGRLIYDKSYSLICQCVDFSTSSSITSAGSSIISAGDFSITSGDSSITSGDSSITSGDSSFTSGGFSITSGDSSIKTGDSQLYLVTLRVLCLYLLPQFSNLSYSVLFIYARYA